MADSSAVSLDEFIEGVCESDPFKVEEDLGHGYVKLRSTEAEKRQAAQDIKCVEDIVIEVLRNSRDAGAKNIFVATAKEHGVRTLVIIDDGAGIPSDMWKAVFEPRVTSKLETAHMDKWGMHGRGMALYSTRVNADASEVVASEEGRGCAIRIRSSESLPEKADQSTFPHFEEIAGIMAMRGPKNILRISCEFALEHRSELKVHVGTPAQIAATLYEYGLATTPAYVRAFGSETAAPLTKSLGLAHDPDDLARKAAEIGLDISLRTARRIIDGESRSIEDLASLMARKSFKAVAKNPPRRSAEGDATAAGRTSVHLSAEDRQHLLEGVMASFRPIAEAYYLEEDVEPKLKVEKGRILVEIPLADRSS